MTNPAATIDPGALVRPDAAHRACYADPDIFDLEMRRIFESTWVFCGHESQVRAPGDYVTLRIGRQPMIMVRARDGRLHVLYNRCPHRGPQLCVARSGNTGTGFRCAYHAWRFGLDGRLDSVPLKDGYAGTGFDAADPAFSLRPAAACESYRGFVFARLSQDGPALADWLGPAVAAIDNMCDRAPAGTLSAVPVCYRVIQQSNWKFFMENQADTLHAPFTHEAAAKAAIAIEDDLEARLGTRPATYRPLSFVNIPLTSWDELTLSSTGHGHCLMEGYLPRPQDPDSLAYEALLRDAHGARLDDILARNFHHAIFYPSVCFQPLLQQVRVIRPLAVDRTLSEIWHFRLDGAPEAIYRRALNYFNLINSPATMVNADDLENWTRAQRGLASEGGDWVSFHRKAGQDRHGPDGMVIGVGTSESPMRQQFREWLRLMAPA